MSNLLKMYFQTYLLDIFEGFSNVGYTYKQYWHDKRKHLYLVLITTLQKSHSSYGQKPVLTKSKDTKQRHKSTKSLILTH